MVSGAAKMEAARAGAGAPGGRRRGHVISAGGQGGHYAGKGSGSGTAPAGGGGEREVGSVTMAEEDHTVLVAEDDPASRTATRLFLQRVGYHVGEAADGPATLREASLGRYDLVVLDLGLPGLDGEEVLARLRRDSSLPVIVL